jgi:hypothetical protein
MRIPTSPHLVPQGSWSYKDPDSGVPFKHAHIDALIADVRRHRIANNLEVGGSWMVRFYDGLCEQNPAAPCHTAGEKEHYINGDNISSFLLTLLRQRESGKQQVSQEEYDRRLSICLRCKMLGNVGCSSCGSFGRVLQRVVAGVKVPDSVAPGKACLACGCTISGKAAYPLEVLKAVDAELGLTPAYDSSCWMKE